MGNSIIPIDPEVAKDKFDVPSPKSDKLEIKVRNEIVNAWNNYTIFDKFGRPWVDKVVLNRILRTSKGNAAYSVAKLNDWCKYKTNTTTYVKGEAVLYLLSQSVLNARSLLRENALQYSQHLYLAIQDCDKARAMRAEHYEFVKKITRTLKSKRIRSMSDMCDELTGEVLNRSKAEFSHIRSTSMYPHLACYVDNGLIVNKDTHKTITDNIINDEHELLKLCNLKKWSISWYDEYVKFIQRSDS
ncbi:hypothetical protein WOC09_23565 [Vibrio parahaemolyticus]|uniref:hypothetical protein n=1 Tax=Vibrio parahaemolyticus TaxID=670 RepID=UPI0004232FF0|nr:hypothetical protein [Vibrio parahaemolyticus]EHV9709130.1 hypothetical protein [Vibrio parahaemolyticus]